MKQHFLRTILCAILASGLATVSTQAFGLTFNRVFDWEKAVSLYKQGQLRPAITEFQLVVSEFPDHADSWKFIGLAYYQLKEYDPAIAPLEKALTLKKNEGKTDLDIIQALGRVQIALQRYDRALPYFELLTRQQPSNAANFYLLGVALANLQRGNEADAAFATAVKLNPKDGDSWYYLGAQHYRAGKYPEAVTALRNALAGSPNNVEMLGLLTETLLRQAAAEPDERKGIAFFEEAIRTATALKTQREDANSLELLGRAYLGAKKYTNAEMTLERAVAANPKPTAALYFATGFAHAQNKAWERAAEMLANADRVSSGDFNTLYYMGYVFENQRKYALALDAYNRAYESSGRTNNDVRASIDRVAQLSRQ